MQADLSDTGDGEEEGLEKEEQQMILNIFDFVETPVREIMTPRVDMCAVDVETPVEELVKVLDQLLEKAAVKTKGLTAVLIISENALEPPLLLAY